MQVILNFNIRLRALRQEAGLSQQDFADEIGISKSSINMYERGEREPSFHTLEAMSVFFNCDIDYLLGKSDIKKRASIKVGDAAGTIYKKIYVFCSMKGKRTMVREFLTDADVEREIARLTVTDAVKLARREQRLKYRRRQTLYTLRALEKRGKELQAAGITMDNIDEMMAVAEQDGISEAEEG